MALQAFAMAFWEPAQQADFQSRYRRGFPAMAMTVPLFQEL
jgi:hypothetical protein